MSYRVAVIFAILIKMSVQGLNCEHHNGYTVPSGDIVKEIGEPLNITCNYNRPLKDNELLTFLKEGEDLHQLVEKKNETSIELYIREPEMQESTYMCHINTTNDDGPSESKLVCMNSVMVGSGPKDITDFRCTSYNMDFLECIWTVEKTYIKTNETVTLIYTSHSYLFPGTRHKGQKRIMKLDLKTVPQYRTSLPKFKVGIKMQNKFGTVENKFTVENFKIVIPNPVENLTVRSMTTHSFYLGWTIPMSMRRHVNLVNRVRYVCTGRLPYDWKDGGIFTTEKYAKQIEFNLTGIPHPNSVCEIAVTLKAEDADENHWSNTSKIIRTTNSAIPARPPHITMGSFEIIENDGNFTVYWQQLPEELQYGKNFTYVVEVEGYPEKYFTISNYMDFYLPRDNNYTINVWSKNDIGITKEKRTLFIPRNRIDKLKGVTKTELGDHKELSWEPLDSSVPITNYTVFFCDYYRQRPYQCKGNITWVVIPPEAKNYTYTFSKNHQVGIAANTLYSSSGIVWAGCTILNNGQSKMTHVTISHLSAHNMTIEWQWECNKSNENEDYILSYCQSSNPLNTCDDKTKMRNVTIKGPANHGVITNLQPYKTYSVEVYIKPVNSSTVRLQTDKNLRETTLAAAPNGRVNFAVTEVTNSSITIKWDPVPEKDWNGVLTNYKIEYNNQTKDTNKNATSYKITNLESYTNYTVNIKACTITCSEEGTQLIITTLKGVPAKIKKPVSLGSNSTSITMSWSKPEPPRGEIHHYQLRIKDSNGEEEYKNVSSQIYSENCMEKRNELKFAVRAVNIINGTEVYGEFSDESENYCHGKGPYIFYIILVAAVVLSFPTIYFIKWIYVKLLHMSDVKVELPDGLTQVPKTKHNDDHEKTIERSSSHDEQTPLVTQDVKKAIPSVDSSNVSNPEKTLPSLDSSEESTPSSRSSDSPSQTDQPEISEENTVRRRPKSTYIAPPYSMAGVPEAFKSPSQYMQHAPLPALPLNEMLKTKNPGYVTAENKDFLPKGFMTTGFTAHAQKELPQFDLLTAAAPVTDAPTQTGYVCVANAPSLIKTPSPNWPASPNDALPQAGYVSVGEVPKPPKSVRTTQPVSTTSSGYVPHNAPKSGKND